MQLNKFEFLSQKYLYLQKNIFKPESLISEALKN